MFHHHLVAPPLGLCVLVLIALALGCSKDEASPTGVVADNAAAKKTATDAINLPNRPTTDESHGESLTVYPNDEFTPSFSQLMANSNRYHGKKIRLEGFLHVEFEGNAIYLCKDHADHLICKEGFWVSFDKKALSFDENAGPRHFHRRWVLIEGTFDKDERGHMSAWSGAIQNIDRIILSDKYYDD
jgi:hypothetical protein